MRYNAPNKLGQQYVLDIGDQKIDVTVEQIDVTKNYCFAYCSNKDEYGFPYYEKSFKYSKDNDQYNYKYHTLYDLDNCFVDCDCGELICITKITCKIDRHNQIVVWYALESISGQYFEYDETYLKQCVADGQLQFIGNNCIDNSLSLNDKIAQIKEEFEMNYLQGVELNEGWVLAEYIKE